MVYKKYERNGIKVRSEESMKKFLVVN